MDRRKKSVYNLIFTVASQIITLVMGLIIPRFFIVSYGSEVNGLQGSIAYIYTYIALLEAGIGTATIQALYKVINNEDKSQVNAILSATNQQYKKAALIYVILMMLFAVIYPFTVNTQIDYWTIFFVVILSGSGSLLTFTFHGKFVLLLQADGRSYLVAILNLCTYLFKNVVKIVLILLLVPFVYIYVGELIIALLMVLIYKLYQKAKYPWVNYHADPNLAAISQSRNVLVHQIANIICNSTDIILLTYIVRDLKLVSVYSMYILVFDAVKGLVQNILSSVNFIMGQTFNADIEKYREYHKVYEIFNFTLSFSLYSIAFILITPFFELYTSGITDIAYVDKYLPLLFTLIKLLTSIREPASQLINYAGHFKQTQGRSIAEASINFVASLILVQFLGIYGILLGTVIAMGYRMLDMYFYTSRRFLDRSTWVSIRQCIIYMCGFAIVMMVQSFIPIAAQNYFDLLVKACIVGVIVCSFFAIYTSFFNWEIVKKIILIIKNRIKRKVNQ